MNTKLDELLDELEGRHIEAMQKVTKSQHDELEAQKELASVQAALDRAKLLEVGERKLATDDCMDCFVRHGRIVKMSPQDSETGIDIFNCPKCWDQKEIDYKSG